MPGFLCYDALARTVHALMRHTLLQSSGHMPSSNDPRRRNFIAGNVILALAAVTIFLIGPLWEVLGVGALILWMAMAATGVYLVTKDKDDGPS